MVRQLKQVFLLIAIAGCLLMARDSSPDVATYYISNSGNDALGGTTQGTAWRTLSKLNSVTLAPGDQVLLQRGSTFIEALPVNQSGNSGAKILYGAYGTGIDPSVTSFVSVPTWTSLGSNKWSAPLSIGSQETMLTINGVLTPPGRFPNTGYLTMTAPGGASTSQFNTTTGSPSAYTGANVIIKKREWIIDKCAVTSISGQTITFANAPGNFPAYTGWGFFFTDHPNTCDLQGEWAHNGNTLVMYSTVNPGTLNVKIATSETVMSIASKNYVKFQNITFEGSKGNLVHIEGGTGNEFQSCNLRLAGKTGLDASFMSGFLMNNCTVSNTNYSGVSSIIGTNQTFTNNYFSYNGMNPQSAEGNNKANHGIWVNGTGTLIQYNTVAYVGYVGIDFSGNNNQVKNNYVHHYCQIVTDGGGIYMSDETNGTGRSIIDNVVMYGLGPRDGTPFSGNDNSMGLYLDESTAGVLISGNFVAYCYGGALYLHKAHDIVITGNTFYDNYLRQVYAAEDAEEDTRIVNITFTGNWIHSVSPSDLTYSLIGTPSINNFFSSINNNVISRAGYSAGLLRRLRIVWDGTYEDPPFNTRKHFNYFDEQYTLAQWKILNPTWDVNSTGTPTDFQTGTSFINFNSTGSPLVIPLDGIYKNIKESIFASGSLTLQPYSGEILKRTGNLEPVKTTINFKGRIIVGP